MDIITLIQTIMTVVGALITLLTILAPLTPSKFDDKVLLFLKGIWSSVKVNKSDQTILINIKKD